MKRVRQGPTGRAGFILLLTLATGFADASERHWRLLHERLMEMQRDASVPVMVLVVLDGGQPVLLETSTLKDARFDPDTPFRWGSISKTVTALTLLEAARRHDLPLSTPVRTLVEPQLYHNPWKADYPLRLAHLVELTAGLADLTRAEFSDNRPRPLEEALERGAQDRVMLWPPGLQHSYSNAAPGFSAAVVERIAGESFEAAARRLVLAPLGMTDAGFSPAAGLPGGFRAGGEREIPYWHMTFPAFGALNASPRAMARLMEALLNQGRVAGQPGLPASTITRAFRAEASLGARNGLTVTYGAGLYGWVRDGHLFYGHGGDADGYRSRFGLLPDSGRGYLVAINTDDPRLMGRLRRRLERALTTDLAPPAPPPAAAVAEDVLDGYTGLYYPSATRFDIDGWQSGTAPHARVAVRDGALVFERNGRTTRLLPIDSRRFRRRDDPAATVVFVEQEGSLYLQGELGNYTRVRPGPCPSFIPSGNCQVPAGRE